MKKPEFEIIFVYISELYQVTAMPKPKNKKTAFIDKKNAVSFQLVHRSQQASLTV